MILNNKKKNYSNKVMLKTFHYLSIIIFLHTRRKKILKRHNNLIIKGYLSLPLTLLLKIKNKSKQDMKRINRLKHCISFINTTGDYQQKRPQLQAIIPYKTILLIVHNSLPYDSAGYALRTLHEAKAYQAQGYNVLIVTRLGYPWDLAKHRAKPEKSIQWIEGIKIIAITGTRQYKVDSDLKYALQYAQKIAHIVQYHHVDILQASSNYINGLAAYFAGKKCQIPFIYEARGMWHITGGSRSFEFRNSEQFNYEDKMEQFVLDHASANIFITDIMKRKYHNNKSIPTLILNNGIDINEIVSHRVLLNYQKGHEFKLLYAGSLVFYEGVEFLISAVSQLADYNVCLDIYGDGPYLDTVKKVLYKLNNNNIHYHGKIPKNAMMELYPKYHGVVIPRIDCEVTRMVPPLKPIEALWHGLPVIVSHLPALTELLEGIKSVLFTEPENISALKKNILVLMHNYPEIVASITKDIEFIKHNKTWDIEIRKMTHLLSTI